jgi:hypothetical protein
VLLAAPLIESKGVTRATNATAYYHGLMLSPSEFGRPFWDSLKFPIPPRFGILLLPDW